MSTKKISFFHLYSKYSTFRSFPNSLGPDWRYLLSKTKAESKICQEHLPLGRELNYERAQWLYIRPKQRRCTTFIWIKPLLWLSMLMLPHSRLPPGDPKKYWNALLKLALVTLINESKNDEPSSCNVLMEKLSF